MAPRSKTAERFARDEETLELAEKLVGDDQSESALKLLAQSVRADSHPELRHTLREVLADVGDAERAYALCLEAAKDNPASGPLAFQLGELAVALDKSEEAIRHFVEAQGAGEESADLYQLWAACEVALGRRAEAEELFRTALEIGHDRVSEVYSAWGKALCDAGCSEEAKEKLSVAIAADALAFYPHAYLGVVELQLGHPELAEAEFRRALALVTHGHDAYAAWIVQELAAVVESRHGIEAAMNTLLQHMREGRRSLQLFERLRRLQGIAVTPGCKRFVFVLAGEDASGEFYEECEVDAEDEASALAFAHAIHQEQLVLADARTTGPAGGPFCGVIDLSDKTRAPDLAAASSDDDDDTIDDE